MIAGRPLSATLVMTIRKSTPVIYTIHCSIEDDLRGLSDHQLRTLWATAV